MFLRRPTKGTDLGSLCYIMNGVVGKFSNNQSNSLTHLASEDSS